MGAATALLGGDLEKAYGRYFFDALTQDVFISFDPNFRSDLWKNEEDVFVKKCMPFIEKSDLCKFSLEEAQLLSGKNDLNEACKILHQAGAKVITITLGSEGTLVSTSETKHTIPSIKVVPVDTTGAGDAFNGGFAAALAEGMAPLEAIRFATATAAISVTRAGTAPSMPARAEIDALLASI